MKTTNVTSFTQGNLKLSIGLLLAMVMMGHAHASTTAGDHSAESTGLKIGINALYEEQGFRDYDNKVAILPSAFYESDKVYARGNRLGYKLWKDDKNELSVVTQYNGINYDPDNASDSFGNLDERKASFFAGASYIRITPIGALRGQVFTDAFGDSDGTLARLTYIGKYQHENLVLYPSAGVQWQDKKYNDHYYGVTKAESDKTGIAQYTAKDSIHPYVNIMGMYEMNDNWGLFFNQNIAYHSDEQFDSPKVDSRTKFTSIVGLTYNFK